MSFKTFAGDSLTIKKRLKNPFEYEKGRFEMSVYPVASLDPSSGMELGIMPVFAISPQKDSLSQRYYRSSSVSSHITYSTKHWMNLRAEGQVFSKKGYSIVAFIQYLNAPDYFYGIGNDTVTTNPSKYVNQYFKTGIELSKCLSKIHFVGFKCDFQSQKFMNIEGNVLNQSVTGFNGGINLGIGPIYKIDSRDNVNYPSKGSLVQLMGLYSFALHSNNNFKIYTLDLRKYSTVFKSLYLASQLYISSSSGDVPFYKLPSLGGKYNLRGISNRLKYIDKNVWFAQTEVRKMIFKRFGIVAFCGVGNTFSSWDTDLKAHIKGIYGFGGRYKILPNDKINLRFDYAFGPNGDSGFYATIREAF